MSTHHDARELVVDEAWFKSSYSSEAGGNCVEVANLIATHLRVAVRDSKVPHGPALLLRASAFAAFVDHVRNNLEHAGNRMEKLSAADQDRMERLLADVRTPQERAYLITQGGTPCAYAPLSRRCPSWLSPAAG